MTIAIDLRPLQIGHENRGIGMYIKSVLEHLPPDEHDYVIYAFEKNNPIKHLNIKVRFRYKLVQTPTIKTALNSPSDFFGLLKLINHSFSKLRPFRPDVFIQFDFTLGIPKWRRTKTVVIGYDLIPLIKKNEYLPSPFFAWQHTLGKKAKLRAVGRSIYYRFKYSVHYRVFKKADEIVAISESTAKSFQQILGIKPSKIHPIPLAPVFSSSEPDKSILKSMSKPYMLYIGGTDSRKRVQDIVYAYNVARGRGADISLVFAGNEFKKVKLIPNVEGRNAIMESPYNKDIVLLGFVTDAEKMALYEAAHVFTFCTTYEGFGLPIIEAMSASCPVIAYNNSSIPEAAGKAALLVETGDYVAVANQTVALFDNKYRQALVSKGIKQAKKFNWKTYTTEFMNVVEGEKQ